jgi:ligand-binding SRPBCC domain-containing protein
MPPNAKNDHPRTVPTEAEYDSSAAFPDLVQQNHFLQLYWDHVHPIFPLIHKQAFVEAWKTR